MTELTREQIELMLCHSIEGIPQPKGIHGQATFSTLSIESSDLEALCTLALRGLDTLPRPIAESDLLDDILGFCKDGSIGKMRHISGNAYAQWIWEDEVLADCDPDPQPTHFIPLSALEKPE